MLKIMLVDESCLKIFINGSHTIFQLKTKIERQLVHKGHQKIEARNQRLIFRGQVLFDDTRELRTIAGLKYGQILHLVQRFEGADQNEQEATDNLQTRALFGALSSGSQIFVHHCYNFSFLKYR